jgi:hypothetical protein
MQLPMLSLTDGPRSFRCVGHAPLSHPAAAATLQGVAVDIYACARVSTHTMRTPFLWQTLLSNGNGWIWQHARWQHDCAVASSALSRPLCCAGERHVRHKCAVGSLGRQRHGSASRRLHGAHEAHGPRGGPACGRPVCARPSSAVCLAAFTTAAGSLRW